MRSSRAVVVAAVTVVAVVACGTDEVDLTGVYQVDRAVGSEPCGDDAPIEFAPFVRFTELDFLGQPYFAYDGCADATAAECTSIGGLLGGFFEPIEDGWLGRSSFASGGGDVACALGLVRQTAVLRGAQLTVEVTRREDQVDGLSLEACSPEEAERRDTAMPCVGHSQVDATRL